MKKLIISVLFVCFLVPVNSDALLDIFKKPDVPQIHVAFRGYVAVWEEKISEDEKEKKGWEQDYIFKYFITQEDALEYLSEHQTEKQPWEGRGWIFFSSGSNSPEKGKFIGLFHVGEKLKIKKVMKKIELKQERWILE